MTKLYNVGIYTRLSVDDANNSRKKGNSFDHADESTSIENQRLILSKFAILNGWIETKVYVDDGYSGGNFNRPGFKQMLEDVKAGTINLVLVKDLSRLGRDYIEVGRYIDVVFPSCGCRFVALLDEIDTRKDDNDMMHFRNLMNDYHLKDLSNKIKTAIHTKAKAGPFMTGKPPYGYMRNEKGGHLLLVDDYAADIVRKVFSFRAEGWGYSRIAEYLNSSKILSPRDYMYERMGKELQRPTLWMLATIKKMLNLETYIGHLVVLRVRNVSHKDKRQLKNPSSEWVRHENTHEAIIDMATWDRVQEVNQASAKKNASKKAPGPTLFMGKLFCMDCGGKMVSHGDVRHNKNGTTRTYYSYNCYRHSCSGYTACSWHTISEIALKKIIFSELKSYSEGIVLNESALLETLKRRMSLDDTEQQNLLRKEVKRLEQRLDELAHITADLYEDKVAGKINESTFTTLVSKNEQERQRWQSVFDESQAKLSGIQEKILSISKWVEVIRKHIYLDDLCRTDVEELIEHIEIGESDYSSGQRVQEVKIFWRFVGHIPG